MKPFRQEFSKRAAMTAFPKTFIRNRNQSKSFLLILLNLLFFCFISCWAGIAKGADKGLASKPSDSVALALKLGPKTRVIPCSK